LKNCGEKGQALIELALCLPFLVLLLFAVFDVGSALISDLVLSQIVREGVRYGGGIARLESGSYVNADGGDPQSTTCPGHFAIQSRIRELLSLSHVAVSDFNIQSSLPNVPNSNRAITVRVSGLLPGFFQPFGDIPFSWELSGPFLYDRFDTSITVSTSLAREATLP